MSKQYLIITLKESRIIIWWIAKQNNFCYHRFLMINSFFIIILFFKQIVILTEINENFNEYFNFNVNKSFRTCSITWCIFYEEHLTLKFCYNFKRIAFEQKTFAECKHFKTVVDVIKLTISYFLKCVRRLKLRYS